MKICEQERRLQVVLTELHYHVGTVTNAKYSSYTTQLSTEFYYSVNVRDRWDRWLGSMKGWRRGGVDDREILPEKSSLQTDGDPLPWPSSLDVWEKIIKHRRWEATQCSPAPLILPLPALRKPHHQLPCIKRSFLPQLTSQCSHFLTS